MRNRCDCCVTVLIAGLMCFAVGCGGPATGTVEGTVSYEGKPLTDATIQLQSPTTGAAEGARLDLGGAYKLDSPLPVGEYRVSVLPFDGALSDGTGTAMPQPKERPDIPAKYRNAGKSDLSLKLSRGLNTFDVNMTAEK